MTQLVKLLFIILIFIPNSLVKIAPADPSEEQLKNEEFFIKVFLFKKPIKIAPPSPFYMSAVVKWGIAEQY